MSDILLPAFIILIVLFTLLGSGVWVGVSLLAVAAIAMEVFTTSQTGPLMASTIWGGQQPVVSCGPSPFYLDGGYSV